MGLWKGFSTSLREYFDETNTYEHAHNALDTLCDSKLHHHGNHYQEKKVIKKRWGRQKHRCTARMSEREGEVEEGFLPRGQKYTNSELWSKNLIPPQPHIETLTQKKLKKNPQRNLKKATEITGDYYIVFLISPPHFLNSISSLNWKIQIFIRFNNPKIDI